MNTFQTVIDKLISETKNNNLKWLYLCDYQELFSKASYIVTDNTTEILDISSFYVKIKDGFFILCEDSDNFLYLITFPTIDSRDFKCLNFSDSIPFYQQELLRLQNLIKKQFPNVEDFLDDFLKS